MQRRCFSEPNSQSILHPLSFLIPLIPAFLTIWALVKVFVWIHLHEVSFWNVLIASTSQLYYIVSTTFLIVWWSLQSFYEISKEDIPSFKNFLIFCFSAVLWSFSLPIFQHISWAKKRKKKKRFQWSSANIRLICILTSVSPFL